MKFGASIKITPCIHENVIPVTDVSVSDDSQGTPKTYFKCMDCGMIITPPDKPSQN